ncbi:MotA/TolQ/ExbB proton channel family protein [Labilibacter marinus]|uniref:MotA/TolQ/ExbB proton channel family protein n=1 Tax=Labilibacter marinus TaxID=1477105 RepID=UPI000834F476|nr:MotA/TolQ/ExbB proton channel family protein [Labilibacter marinus]
MQELFIKGGLEFMGLLTILLVITTAWLIYYFVVAYISKKIDKEVCLRKLRYGKDIGLFTLTMGVFGSLIGFMSMFDIIEDITAKGIEITAQNVFGGIKATMIVIIYGILIYLFSLLLWFIFSLLIEKKIEKQT